MAWAVLAGICTVQDPVLLVLELCELGSLQGYLKKGAKEEETTAMDVSSEISARAARWADHGAA